MMSNGCSASPRSTTSLPLDTLRLAPRRIDEFALFSDGIEKLVLHDATKTVHESFFRKMLPPVRKLEAPGFDAELSEGLKRYLSSPVICERTDDDKTLVLASRRLPAEQA